MAENYDVVVIGAGPGGYIAAIRAATVGVEVNHFIECREDAVVHVRRGQGDFPERGRQERLPVAHLVDLVEDHEPGLARPGVGADQLPVGAVDRVWNIESGLELGDRGTLVSERLAAWNRWQDWALIEVPSAGSVNTSFLGTPLRLEFTAGTIVLVLVTVLTCAGIDALLNTTQDRSRLRGRLRVDLKADVAPTVTAERTFCLV